MYRNDLDEARKLCNAQYDEFAALKREVKTQTSEKANCEFIIRQYAEQSEFNANASTDSQAQSDLVQQLTSDIQSLQSKRLLLQTEYAESCNAHPYVVQQLKECKRETDIIRSQFADDLHSKNDELVAERKK